MTHLEFFYSIQQIFQNYFKDDPTAGLKTQIQYFLNEIKEILLFEGSSLHQFTLSTILFEGFYRHLNDSSLKKDLLNIRAQRWQFHYGIPTFIFLLCYKSQIEQTECFFKVFFQKKIDLSRPWRTIISNDLKVDVVNQFVYSFSDFNNVEVPPLEVTGFFTKTYNPIGGFTTTPCDPISQKFIKHAEEIAECGGKVLEIGAAFGAATLAAISKGVTVYCNDSNIENLSVVKQRYLKFLEEKNLLETVDTTKLFLVPGFFPEELTGLPPNFFDAILICRVFHFFSGEKIEESLELISKLLTPQGKIYIVCETPFLKNWQLFIPEFQRRVNVGVEWPGEITNPSEFESSGRVSSLPKFVHWISKEILERSLLRTNYSIEYVNYINRKGQFPEDLLLPEYGKESVGAIAKRR